MNRRVLKKLTPALVGVVAAVIGLATVQSASAVVRPPAPAVTFTQPVDRDTPDGPSRPDVPPPAVPAPPAATPPVVVPPAQPDTPPAPPEAPRPSKPMFPPATDKPDVPCLECV